MKKLIWLGMISFLFVATALFSKANSGDFKLIKVEDGETLNKICDKYLKSRRYKKDLLRFNRLTAAKVKPGIELKIPYSISKDRAARIKFFRGTIQRETQGKWTPVRRIGTVLLQHDRIKTGNRSKLEIKFDDGSLLQISSNTIISLKEYAYSRKGRTANINLKNGSLFANVKKLRRNSSFTVSTVTAVAGVRGTQFYVSIDDKKKVKVEVYKGKVEVGAQNKKVNVKAGQETIVNKGSTPQKPKRIKSPRKIKWAK